MGTASRWRTRRRQPGTFSELPAMIRLPLPGSRLTSTSLATVVWYLAAMSLSVSPCLIV